jgi:hypothetical protein
MNHNSLTSYLRRNPSFPLTRGLRFTLNAWRKLNSEDEGPYTKKVYLDRLLCGGEQGLSAAQYARHTGNLLRGSTPVSKSPHVQFLEQNKSIGEKIFSPGIFDKTGYYQHAVESINTVGEFLQCTHEDQIATLARQFVQLSKGEQPLDEYARTHHFRAPGSLVYVRPIRYSDCFEVVDGLHQLAIAYVHGEKEYSVFVMPPAVLTPLQELVLDSAYCRGNRELYQPISSPEFNGEWVTVRRCEDRFELMKSFLKEHDLMPPNLRTSLDLAFSYGWFVKGFSDLGFEARGGGEIDWASCEVGRRVYGLRKEQLTRSELVRFLQGDSGRYDVVSCLSILHHFIIGLPYRARISAEEMIRLVDEKTGTVLFLDTGQCHELWFKENLAGWDKERIENWIRANTSFTKIYRLGKDSDDVPPFETCYGRTLFACMR